MRVDRLEILATHLEKLAETPPSDLPREFDLTMWWRGKAGYGTAACAIGEATQIPALQEQGLRLGDIVWGSCRHLGPVFEDHTDWEAVQEFFDLTEPQAWNTFSDSAYSQLQYEEARNAEPLDVAARIREIIKATP